MTRIDEYQEQVARINQRILELKSIHNAVNSFHTKLPSELLIQIFRHIEPTSRQDIQLSHVCRLWRSAINRAPEFWVDILRTFTVIDHPHGLPLFKIFVERSAPLHFGLALPSRELSMIRQLPDSHRINFLSITFNPKYRTNDDLLDLIDMELPNLRHLNCYYSPSRSIADPPAPEIRNARTSDKIPHLRILHAHGRCVTLAFIVTSLRELRIFGPTIATPDFILEALRACPGLEKLTIENVSHNPEAEAHMDSGPPIPLERLKLLTLVSISGKRFAPLFLPRLTYPPTTQIRITGAASCLSDFLCHSSPPTPTPAASTIQSLIVTILPDHTQHLSRCEVKGSSDLAPSRLLMSLYCIKWGDDRDLKLFLDVPAVFLLPDVCNVTHLTFSFECGLSVSYPNWEAVLGACSQIRHLAVRFASCRTLLRVLRREELLPQLLSLSITCENGRGVHESLVLAIESRAEMDVSPLDELRFYNQLVARRKEVVAFPPFSRARLERLKVRVRDVYTGAQDGTLQLDSKDAMR